MTGLAWEGAALGAAAGLLVGLLAPSRREGASSLLDAVFEELRRPLVLAMLPVPALLPGVPFGAVALAVIAFVPVLLHVFEARRRGTASVAFGGAAWALILVAASTLVIPAEAGIQGVLSVAGAR